MVKGQIKIQQMAIVLVAIVLLFVIVGLFFTGFGINYLRKSATNIEEKNAKLLVAKLSDTPEFSCGESFGTGKVYCVDFDKAMALSLIEDYSDFWGVAEIKIRKIYPKEKEKICNIENYPDCNTLIVFSDKNVKKGPMQFNYIILCRKESYGGKSYDKCEIGELLVAGVVKK